ncbi:MFS transporter [Paenibacillus sp. JCM 10914]|uniref:MFS transporter n=1 Tax=Paenibacillus sp. JCM 10914 TaxID=1236974 RepID=UPI0003CC46FA|nr:MFS transporter [Paenibacillus sp. JCM 10914]GAE06606.1 tetracycline resistance protein [Paenibacillus sp. JCM 10914]
MIQKYIDSPNLQEKLYKKTLLVVVFSQLFGGAGLAAGLTVGALLAQDMLKMDSFAGVPVALITAGSALGAWFVGRLTQRWGRGPALASGFLAGGIAAVGIIAAAVYHNIYLLLISLLIYGAGTATNMQARYAGTDLAKPSQRAGAVSMAMVATTFGAVAGPNMVGVMGNVAESMGIPALAGPFILAAAAFTLAGLILLLFLRPDPYAIAQGIEQARSLSAGHASHMAGSPDRQHQRGVWVGASVMILTQVVMVSIMTMTPIHMKHHGHDLSAVGLVIGIHIGAMYLPSLVTGYLVDKIGRTTMSIVAGIVLLGSGILAAVAPAESMTLMIIALALLGIGWNLGFISGTAMIIDATPPATRAKTQGTVDVLIALAGASGGVLSGMVVAGTSYATLSLAGGLLALIMIPLCLSSAQSRKSSSSNDAPYRAAAESKFYRWILPR